MLKRFFVVISFLVVGNVLPAAVPDWLRPLPGWARPHVVATFNEHPPAGDHDAWVVFERTEVSYAGDNEIWTHHYRLVQVLTERGVSEGIFSVSGIGGKATKIKKLKGWNLKPNGEIFRLDQDSVVFVEDASNETFSTSNVTTAFLPNVVKGSWIAFESIKMTKLPAGPVSGVRILEKHPVRTWELETGMNTDWLFTPKPVECKIDLIHFEHFFPTTRVEGGQSVRISQAPSLPKDERGHPDHDEFLPEIRLRFLDTQLTHTPIWNQWHNAASWYSKHYSDKTRPVGAAPKGSADLPSLQALWRWLGQEFRYKAVYLTPERGWIPEDPAEVVRKRYGDCKDLSCLLLSEAQGLGFKGAPVLARIISGHAKKDAPPFQVFNHVIAALRLEKSLGLAAEVETAKGRYLIVDATDPFTPLGFLGEGHRGREVMICLPDGAEWVKIPDKAIQPLKVELALEATCIHGGQLEGSLTIKEIGNQWNLRSAAHHGKIAIRDHLQNSFEFPPTAQLDILSFSDPLLIDQPLEVKVRIKYPKGFRESGNEININSFLLNFLIPDNIQKVGVARVYPIKKTSSHRFHFQAKLRLPYNLAAIVPEKRAETPFRHFQWKAEVTHEGLESLVTLNLSHQHVPIYFGWEQREQGVQEWKKDRNLIKNLIVDGLAFRVDR